MMKPLIHVDTIMSGYIKRETALEIIDKYDKAVEGNDAHAVVLAVRDIISTICPAADVVDVVRCKDCKCFEDIQAAHFCNKFGGFVTKEDYCSRIERKDGES